MPDINYKIDIDASSIQQKLMQVRMSLEQAVKGAVSGYVGSVGTGMMDPLQGALGGGAMALNASLSASTQRMTIGTQAALGGAQMAASIGEYANPDFYRQLFLGAAPYASHQALAARMAVGAQMSRLPISSAFGGSMAEIGSFMGQVGLQHANEIGFAQPFGEALAASNFSNARTPFRLSSMIGAMENSMWSGRAFGLSGTAIAEDFNRFSMSGMTGGQMEGAFKELQLARMAGVSDYTADSAIQRAMAFQRQAQRAGGFQPITPAHSIELSRWGQNMATALLEASPDMVVTPEDMHAIAMQTMSLSAYNGGRDPTRGQISGMLRARFGAQMDGVDVGELMSRARASNTIQEYREEQSENLARNQAAISEAFSVRGLARGLLGGLFPSLARATGPLDSGGQAIGTREILSSIDIGREMSRIGLTPEHYAAAQREASGNQALQALMNPDLDFNSKLQALAPLAENDKDVKAFFDQYKASGGVLSPAMAVQAAKALGGAVLSPASTVGAVAAWAMTHGKTLFGRDEVTQQSLSALSGKNDEMFSGLKSMFQKAGIKVDSMDQVGALNMARAIDVQATQGTPQYNDNLKKFLQSGGTREMIEQAKTALMSNPNLPNAMTQNYTGLVLSRAAGSALSDPGMFDRLAIEKLSGSEDTSDQAAATMFKERMRGATDNKSRQKLATDLMNYHAKAAGNFAAAALGDIAGFSGAAVDKRDVKQVGANLIKSLHEFIDVVQNISSPRKSR